MNKYQLSLTSLLLAGVFATGCSQQQIQEEQPEPMPEPAPVIQQPEPIPAPEPIIRPAPVVKPAPVIRKPAPRKPAPRRHVNPDCHYHPANARSKALRHCHKNPKGKHHYGNRVVRRVAPVRRAPAPIRRAPIRRAPIVQKPRIDVRALQRKLKSKGYYKGPIDGVVGNGTRDALKHFQNR